MLDRPSAKGIEAIEPSLPFRRKRGKIDSKIGLGVSVVFLMAAPSGGPVGLSSSSKALVRSSSSNVAPLADLNSNRHSPVGASLAKGVVLAIRKATVLLSTFAPHYPAALGTPYSAMLRRNERKIFKAPLAWCSARTGCSLQISR
jgi:hypothetical protein